MSGWLLVRSMERTVALPVGVVDELVDLPVPLPVPAVLAAVRGVAAFRGRLVPLVHLGAAEATELRVADAEPLPHGWSGRWAAGTVRQTGGLVPILDVEWLAERLTGGAGSATA